MATMALIVTLSVFNGFHDLVEDLFSRFDADLKVVPVKGKAMPAEDATLARIRSHAAIETTVLTLEDQALAVYNGHQRTVTVKGVDDGFLAATRLDKTFIGDTEARLRFADIPLSIPGQHLAQMLSMPPRYQGWLHLFAPVREGQVDMMNPAASLMQDSILSGGAVFAVKQAKYDENYLLVPLFFAQKLFGRQGEVSALELKVKQGHNIGSVKRQLRNIGDGQLRVLDREEQQADTFGVMNIEKLIAYIFLTFILLVACFNLIGSLTMLMIDKKNNVQTLRNLGATDRQAMNIFLIEGRLITLIGAVVGLLLGLGLCWMQQRYGIIGLGGDSNAFIVSAYPVSIRLTDVVLVLLTVVVVGFLSAWYPTHYLSRRFLH